MTRTVEADYLVVGAGAMVPERCRIVDAAYLAPDIPAEAPPRFRVSEDARVIPVNDLARLDEAPSQYVIVGSGKTATDACGSTGSWFIMAKAPTLATWELEQLRTIEHVVRLGHVGMTERSTRSMMLVSSSRRNRSSGDAASAAACIVPATMPKETARSAELDDALGRLQTHMGPGLTKFAELSGMGLRP